jgi:signal peptidase
VELPIADCRLPIGREDPGYQSPVPNPQSPISSPQPPTRSSLAPADEVKRDLALEVLRAFGETRIRVTGTSMLPAVWPGDVLTIRRQGLEEIRPGDLVLSRREGRFVAHRVVQCGSGTLPLSVTGYGQPATGYRPESGCAASLLITRGDRLRTPDPPVAAGDLLGRVVWIERGGRRVDPRLTWSGRLSAWVLCRWECATRAVIYLRRREQVPSAQ